MTARSKDPDCQHRQLKGGHCNWSLQGSTMYVCVIPPSITRDTIALHHVHLLIIWIGSHLACTARSAIRPCTLIVIHVLV